MITVENLVFGYGRTPVLQDINFDLKAGEILGVIGPNGSGKSTLLRLLRGLLVPHRGDIRWEGRPAHRIARREMAQRAAVVPQSTPASFPYSVQGMVAMGRYARGGSEKGGRKAVERALALADVSHLADRPVTALSGGELQRVYLARALAQETPVLLLDEATSHLDLDHRLEINRLLQRLNAEKGVAVVQISHDLELAAESSHRLLLLDRQGRMAALGPPSDVLTPENLREVFRVDVQVEANPYTGAPRLLPTLPPPSWEKNGPRVHVICGGGSGGELLRLLHLSGCRLSTGPLNTGDSDLALSEALGFAAVREEPFAPLSERALADAKQMALQADVVVVAPTPWGRGNISALGLAEQCLRDGRPLMLVAPREQNDYTGGAAWSLLKKLQISGAAQAESPRDVLVRLQQYSSVS